MLESRLNVQDDYNYSAMPGLSQCPQTYDKNYGRELQVSILIPPVPGSHVLILSHHIFRFLLILILNDRNNATPFFFFFFFFFFLSLNMFHKRGVVVVLKMELNAGANLRRLRSNSDVYTEIKILKINGI